jgi:nucleotide-binding universal stress UspA family protein
LIVNGGIPIRPLNMAADQREQMVTGIVVGVDGSANSEQALHWAMEEAAAHNAPLTIIAVHPVMKSYWTGRPVSLEVDHPALEHTREAVEKLTQEAASRLGDARPASVNVRVFDGFPAEELIEASHDADVIVVGSRGGGGFARLLLGSVSSQVVQHAACPVVVVPHQM